MDKEFITKLIRNSGYPNIICAERLAEILMPVLHGQEAEEKCKYSTISHGIGLSGKLEEIKVHCEMNPENDYTEVKPKQEWCNCDPKTMILCRALECDICHGCNKKIKPKQLPELPNTIKYGADLTEMRVALNEVIKFLKGTK